MDFNDSASEVWEKKLGLWQEKTYTVLGLEHLTSHKAITAETNVKGAAGERSEGKEEHVTENGRSEILVAEGLAKSYL